MQKNSIQLSSQGTRDCQCFILIIISMLHHFGPILPMFYTRYQIAILVFNSPLWLVVNWLGFFVDALCFRPKKKTCQNIRFKRKQEIANVLYLSLYPCSTTLGPYCQCFIPDTKLQY